MLAGAGVMGELRVDGGEEAVGVLRAGRGEEVAGGEFAEEEEARALRAGRAGEGAVEAEAREEGAEEGVAGEEEARALRVGMGEEGLGEIGVGEIEGALDDVLSSFLGSLSTVNFLGRTGDVRDFALGVAGGGTGETAEGIGEEVRGGLGFVLERIVGGTGEKEEGIGEVERGGLGDKELVRRNASLAFSMRSFCVVPKS